MRGPERAPLLKDLPRFHVRGPAEKLFEEACDWARSRWLSASVSRRTRRCSIRSCPARSRRRASAPRPGLLRDACLAAMADLGVDADLTPADFLAAIDGAPVGPPASPRRAPDSPVEHVQK
ncbi:hypothetical protein STRIP9103_09482 [Streptomyces ipomoeae 91-03]|uniref:Uncharacterized protein n=1 Tax=Streptomyces ipomoeae 91-03 TaxID=698759 RepID=L1L667_9ACTN|nr:hypothetical protein STRIP9103_09482 [Streptomyces ipomoeae 91-03]